MKKMDTEYTDLTEHTDKKNMDVHYLPLPCFTLEICGYIFNPLKVFRPRQAEDQLRFVYSPAG
jgi:hypothetical protein